MRYFIEIRPPVLPSGAKRDELEIQLHEGILKNITTGKSTGFIPLPDFAFKIAEAGGLLQSIKK